MPVIGLLVLAAMVALSSPVLAHDTATEAAAHAPSGWDVAMLLGLAVSGALYLRGSGQLARRRARVPRHERAAFWVGWTTLVVAVAPPLDDAAALAFSWHMAQHELLLVVGAPLVAIGRPVAPWLWALPPSWRARAGRLLQQRAVGGAWTAATHPLAAAVAHGLVVWVWHLPVLYEAALRHEGIHALQHASFAATAAGFWWGLVYGRHGRPAYGASVLYLFITMVHTGVLGALFALSSAPFFPLYAERAAATGRDATGDQQLAGLVMWIPAGIVLTASGLALLAAWISAAEHRARRFGRRA